MITNELKPILVLDVDGVLADFTGATLKFLERNYGIYHDEPLRLWDFMETPTLKPYRKVCKGHWATPGFAAALEPYPGVVEIVAELRRWADIRFATSPMGSNPTWIAERNAWLVQYFGARGEGVDITHTTKKSDVPGHVFVDDKPDNVIEYQRTVPAALVYLRTHSYNVGVDWKGRRLDGLQEILTVMESLWKIYN